MAILAKTQNYIELCFSYNVGFTSGRLQQKCGDRFDLAVCIAACIDETFKSDGEVCTTFVPVTHSALPSILPDVCVCVCVCVFMNFLATVSCLHWKRRKLYGRHVGRNKE